MFNAIFISRIQFQKLYLNNHNNYKLVEITYYLLRHQRNDGTDLIQEIATFELNTHTYLNCLYNTPFNIY